MTDDATFYRENGYVLVPGVFDAAEVEEMREAIGRILENVEGTAHDRDHAWRGGHIDEDELSTLQVKGYHDLPYHDAVFTRMVAQPRIVEVLTSLIGPDVQLHHTKMLVKPPEQGAPFPMHQDYPYFPHERHSVLAASIHLDDTDEENGACTFVPGSHKLGPLEAHGESKTVDYPLESGTPCPAGAGDVLFFNYLTVHGSDTNRSTRTRRNILFQYRDPADPPLLDEGVEDHVDWGMGLMVAGGNPGFWDWRPRFRVRQAQIARRKRREDDLKSRSRRLGTRNKIGAWASLGDWRALRLRLTMEPECGYVATADPGAFREFGGGTWRVTGSA